FGRGIGGKYMTALDVTAPGTFLQQSLQTNGPIVLWSRGNPDTTDGTPTGTPAHDANDAAAYLKMGQTWSTPGGVRRLYQERDEPEHPGGGELRGLHGFRLRRHFWVLNRRAALRRHDVLRPRRTHR